MESSLQGFSQIKFKQTFVFRRAVAQFLGRRKHVKSHL